MDMYFMSRRLRKLNFPTINFGYRSVANSIENHVRKFSEKLRELNALGEPFNIVGHSMGGIITRAALCENDFENLQRVVLLAPPNSGSHIARKMVPWFGWLTRSLDELSDRPDSYVNQLSNSLLEKDVEFGIIEASKDRVIRRGGVMLEGYTDYVMINGHHGVLSYYPETIQRVANFLQTGSFDAVASDIGYSTKA